MGDGGFRVGNLVASALGTISGRVQGSDRYSVARHWVRHAGEADELEFGLVIVRRPCA